MERSNNLIIEFKSVSPNGKITGYAARFGNVDSYNDIIMQGAFKKTLKEKTPKEINFLYEHDESKTVGYLTMLQEDEQGLYFEGQILEDKMKAAEIAYNEIKEGYIDSLSIGYIPTKYEVKDGIRMLKEIDLYEISLVKNPANPKANILSVKSFEVDEKEHDLEEAEVPEECKVGGYQVFNVKDGKYLLNFKAVEGLPQEVKEANKELIQSYYKAFRKSFDDYTLFSPVCDRAEVMSTWDMKEFDKYLKKDLTNKELKVFYNRLGELKNKNKEQVEIESDEIKELKDDLNAIARQESPKENYNLEDYYSFIY